MSATAQRIKPWTPERAKDALRFHSPSCTNDEWVAVGMALHDEWRGDEAGLDIWDEWSSGGDNYRGRKDCAQRWKTFKAGGGRDMGYIHAVATSNGWKDTSRPDPVDPAVLRREEEERAERKRKFEEKEAKKHAIAAKRAADIWDKAKPAPEDHPYLIKKKIKPHGCRVGPWTVFDPETGQDRVVTENALLVRVSSNRPIDMQTLQAIFPEKDEKLDRDRDYLARGKKAGGFCSIGGETKQHNGRAIFILAEGFATSASVHEATEHRVFACMDAGNLAAVARAIREKKPEALIIIAADHDKDGAGERAAQRAAEAAGGFLSAYTMPKACPADFSDLWTAGLKEQIVEHITDAIERAAELEPDQPADASAPAPATETQGAALVAGLVSDADDAGAGDGDANQISVVRPSFVTYEEFTSFGRPGLYYHGVKQKGETEVEFDQWIASPIHAVACTSDERDTNHGLVLRLFSSSGRWREFAVPMQLLSGSGEELRAGLLDMGMRIDVDGHRLLNRWLMNCKPKKRLTAAKTVGWHGDGSTRAFVLPSKTVGNQDVILQSDRVGHDEFTTNGSLQGWRQEIGRLCAGNRWLVLAVAAALAGPVLKLVSRPGVGIHFVGDSSQGKSTLLHASTSVWGGLGFMRTWRATSNGLEGVAAALNDTALILDEISEAPPADVGAIVYSIGNGTGKSRAGRNGKAREVAKWRLSLISSGEKTLATIMGEAGKSVNAGQDVRMLEIPAVRSFGVLDELHGLEDGAAVSNRIRAAANEEHYGHLGPAFVERLIADGRDFRKAHKEYVADPGFIACHPLEVRAAEALALIALAGELATEYGLTGWTKGEALDAAVEAFKKWKEFRGEGQTETRRILQAVETFIDRHGDSRFSDAAKDVATQVRDRAGWWRDDEGGRTYLFTGTGLKEAMKGFEFNQGLEALSKSGWIVAFDKGKHSKNTRVNGNQRRLYLIRPKVDDESVCSGGADSSTEPERAPSESPAPSARQRPSRDEDFSEPPV